VDRPVQVLKARRGFPSASAGGSVSSQIYQGTIRLIGEDEGPLVRFTLEDYKAMKGQQSRLQRGDLVEFTLVTDRRSSKIFTRNIVMIQSFKEKKMLEEATLEKGIIISLKEDYGFLRSISRREHVYFHFSHVVDHDTVLEEGQCAEFLVLKDKKQDESFKAQRIRLLPKGSVVFETVIKTNTQGKVNQKHNDSSGFIELDEPLTPQDLLMLEATIAKKKKRPIKSVRFDKHQVETYLGDTVSCDIIYIHLTGIYAAVNLKIIQRNKKHEILRGFHLKINKNACFGFVVMEPTEQTSTVTHSSSIAQLASPNTRTCRWDNIKEEKEVSSLNQGYIVLIDDPSSIFSQDKLKNDLVPTPTNDYLLYHNDRSHIYCRGDLVSFTKGKSPRTVKDLKILKKSAATKVFGSLTDINSESKTAKFNVTKNKLNIDLPDHYYVSFSDIVGCDPLFIKENMPVEGILLEDGIVGVCRKTDLCLDNKLFGNSKGERKPLNLTVRKELKDLGGKIIAQSCMAKGPDGTPGFPSGWTKRSSIFAEINQTIPSPHEDTQSCQL